MSDELSEESIDLPEGDLDSTLLTESVHTEESQATADASPTATPRTRPRARRRSRTRRRRLLALGVAVAALVGWLALASPVTLVRHVVVDAPRGISEESLRLASGISATDHVPAVDAAKVREAIMTAIPAVSDVQVHRSLPDTVRLVVTARTPLAAVAAAKGYNLMDSEGVLYDTVASAKKVPVITAHTEVGRQTARDVLLSLPEDLRAKVQKVSARTRDDVALTLRGGAKVRWGSTQDAALKARVLAGLMAIKADTYDVSAPLLPTTTGGDVATATTTG